MLKQALAIFAYWLFVLSAFSSQIPGNNNIYFNNYGTIDNSTINVNVNNYYQQAPHHPASSGQSYNGERIVSIQTFIDYIGMPVMTAYGLAFRMTPIGLTTYTTFARSNASVILDHAHVSDNITGEEEDGDETTSTEYSSEERGISTEIYEKMKNIFATWSWDTFNAYCNLKESSDEDDQILANVAEKLLLRNLLGDGYDRANDL